MNADLPRGALTKPSSFERDIAKHERRINRRAEKEATGRREADEWAKVATLVRARDGGLCRVCKVRTQKVGVGDPRQWGHVHHIVYRSAGGGDYPRNLVLLCGKCHDDEHRHRISIDGTADKLSISAERTVR